MELDSKNSYYTDIDDRVNLRAIESLDRFNELKDQGHKNLILTGFTKLDRLFTIDKREIAKLKKNLKINESKNDIICPKFLSYINRKNWSSITFTQPIF